jgi:hypothetical protein
MTAAEASAPAPPPRPLHRVQCPCEWVGYRRNPHCRPCPACAAEAAKLQAVWLAGCVPHRGRCCYLVEIRPAYRHARHYLGTTDLRRRWPEHLAGGYDPATYRNNGPGARLLAAALHAGCQVELVRVWHGAQARTLEQRLKQRRRPDAGSLRAGAARSLKPLCPLCNPAGRWRQYPDLPDPAPLPRPGRFRHDPELWDADREWDEAFPHLAYGTPAVALQVGGAP